MDGPFATMDEETRKTYMERGRAMMEARRAEILSHSPEKFEQLRRQGYIIFKRYLQGEQWMPLQGKLHSPLITTSEEPSKAHKQNMGSSGSSHLPQDDNITAKEYNMPTTKLAEWCAPTDKPLFPESTPAEPEELHHVALLTMCGPSVSCVDGDDEDFKQLSYNKDVATLHKTMEIQHQQIEQLNAQLRNQESEIDVLTNELKGVTEANARQLQKEEELQSLQEALQERDRELQLRLESVNEQNDSLKTQIMELHILLELKAKELQKLKDDNNALRGEVVTIQNEGDTIKESETKCKERILQLEAANSELGVQVDVSKKEVEAAHQRIKNLEQELTRERKINEDSTVAYNKVKKELECKEKTEQQKQEEIKQRKRAEKAMIRELSELQDRIHTLESTQETENNSSTAGIPLNPFAKMVIQGEASQPRVEDDDDAVVFGVGDSVTPSVCVETGMALRVKELEMCISGLQQQLESERADAAREVDSLRHRIAEHDELLRQKLEEYKAEQEAKFLEELEACRTGNESDDAILERLNTLQACNDQLKEELRELEERQQVELANVTQEAADRIAEHDELLRQKLEEYKAEQEAKFLEELETCRTGNESDDAILERLNALQACNDQLKEELRELEERQQVELANVTQEAGGTRGYCGVTVFVASTSSSVGSVRSLLGADSCLPCINLETADCGAKEAECCISHREVVGNGSHCVDVLKGSEKVSSRVQTDSPEAIGVVCRSFVDMTEDRENGERVDYGNLNGLSYCNFSGDIPDDIGMGNLVICRKQSKWNKSCQVDDGVVPLDDSNEAELRVEDCQTLPDVTRNRVELQREEQSRLHSENGGSEKEVHTAELDHTTLKHNVVEDLFAEKVLTIPLVVEYLFRAVLDAHEYLVRHHVNFQRKLLSRCDVIERAASDAMIEGERQCEEFMAVVEGAEVERQGLLRQITELQQEVATFKASSERVESELCSNKEEHSKVIRKLHEKLDATQHEMEVVKVEYANSLHKMELVKTENANVLHLFSELKKTAADVEDEQRREVVRLQEALREKTHTSRELLELTEQKLAAALEEVDQCKCSREDLEKQLRSTKSSLDRVIPRLERAETERDSLESQLLDATQEVQLLTQRNRTAEEASRRQADALTATVEELREANTKLGESCKEQQAQLDSLKAQLAVAETELERLRMRATQQESDAQRLNGKLCELESSSTLQVEEAAAALRAAEMRIAALEPRKAALQEEVDHVRRKNCELQGCCDELKERLRQAADTTQNAEQMHNRRVQQLNEQVEALQLEVKQLQEAHDGLVADREQLVREQVGAAQETERIKQNLERCNQQKERLQNEIQWQRESYESEIQAAQETLNGAREELSKWRHTLEEAEAQQNAMRDTISMLQVERTSNHEQIRAVRLQLREYQELLAQERGYLHETGLKFLRSCSDECSVQKSPSVPYTPQRECGTRETCSLTSAPAGCCDSQKTQGSASQKSIARLRNIVAQKSLLLEEREAQVESLYSEMKTAIVHVVQEARNAQLGSKALAPVDQRELLLNNIMHNLLLRLGRLSRVVREPSTDSTGSGSRDPANAEVSPNSSTNPEAVLNFSSAATPKERVSGGGDESTDAR